MRVIYLIVAIILIALFGMLRKKMSVKNAMQVWSILLLLSVFYFSALISKASIKTEVFWILLDGFLIIIPFFILSLDLLRQLDVNIFNIKNFKNYIKKKKYIIALVIITIFSRIWLVNTNQSWDSSEYYYAIMKASQSFDFAPSSFFEYFDLLGHPSYGYALIVCIGEFLTPQSVVGVLTVVLILTCIANIKIFYLIKEHLAVMSAGKAFIGTLLCIVCPLYWATFACTMPDYLMLLFFILMVFYLHEKKWILSIFWGCVLCFSKEVGIILVAGYFSFRIIAKYIVDRESYIKRIQNIFKSPEIYSGIIIGIVFLIYMIFNRGISQWSHSAFYAEPLSWTGNNDLSYNTFGIQSDNIVTRIIEYFVVNFNWILSGILVFTVLIFLIKRKESKNIICWINIWPIVGELFFYGLFMCVYITSGAIRYNIVFSIPYIMVCYVIYIQVLRNKTGYILSIFCILLFIGQSFKSIDPITNSFFGTKDMGNTKMTCISQKENRYPGGDYYIYNLQYINFDKNIEKMFQEVDLKANDTVLIAGEDFIECTTNSTIASLNGRHNDKKWDAVNKRYINSLDSEMQSINTLTTNSLLGLRSIGYNNVAGESYVKKQLNNIQGRVIVYFSPIYQQSDETEMIDRLKQWFYIGERNKVETNGIELYYYEMYKKIEIEGIDDDNSYFLSNIPDQETVLASGNKNADGIFEVDMSEYYRRIEEKVNLEEIDNRYYLSLQQYAYETEEQERQIKKGDTIAITIACYDENGQYINTGYSPKGTVLNTVTIGTGELLPEIEDTLLEHKVGDNYKNSCVFPEVYSNYPAFSGKKITLQIQINKIETEIPDFDDALIFEYTGFDTITSYKNMIKETLVNEIANESNVQGYVVEESDLEVSTQLLNKNIGSLKAVICSYADEMGINEEEFLEKYVKISQSELEYYSKQYAYYLSKLELMQEGYKG